MYDPNESFANHFPALLLATFKHSNSNNFEERVAARDEMTFAENKIKYAQRHPDFSVKFATRIAAQAKAKHEVLLAAFRRAA